MALAATASPAAAQHTTIGDGPAAASVPLCPGGSPVTADHFTASSTGAGETIRRLRVQVSPPGAYATIHRLEIKTMAGVTLASAAPAADQLDVTPATPIPVGAAETQFRIDVTPKPRANMPTSSAGVSVTARVLDVLVSYRRTVSDPTSALLTLDNTPPAEVGWTTMTVTTAPSTQISLGFRPPLSDPGFVAPDAGVVILRRAGQPVTDAPALGATLASVGAVGAAFGQSEVRFNGAAGSSTWSVTDGGAAVVAGTSYYYRAFVRDSCGNWSGGDSVGPVLAGVSSEGDPTAFSLKPMAGILNPNPGVVTSPFKVQVRIHSPRNAGAAQAIQLPPTVTLTDGAGGTTSFNLVQNTAYGDATDSGVFEPAAALSIGAGAYTLHARVQNASGFTLSAKVPIAVAAGRGDGNLLRRDNSSQLCNDCHALPTHSSEATTNKYGQWYTGCRSCHQPHGTANASLVGTEVTPPQVAGPLPPTRVHFSRRTGFDPAAGATNTVTISAASYANGDRSGPCQACHTRTAFYTRPGAPGDGGPGSHYTQRCTSCHQHTKGFRASCTACHGALTPRAPATANADALLDAAPPRDTSGNTATTFVGVGAHEKHVNGTTWRTDPLGCAECHPIPNTHDGVVDVPFLGSLVNASYDWGGGVGPAPTWDKGQARCSSTYCHGNFRGGDNLAQPVWTAAGTVVCGSCHGRGGTDPRPPNHTFDPATCTGCHPDGYSMTTVAKGEHLDGTLDVRGCDGCHGEPTRSSLVEALDPSFTSSYVRPMPPRDTSNETATTATGVGAHERHVNNPASLSRPVACETCHGALPTDGGHSTLPTSIAAAVGWNGSSCSNGCHGSAARGGSLPNPVWTVVDGTYRACSSCHGQPPPRSDLGHPPNPLCGSCHAGYTGATVVQATHIDGSSTVNTATGCARCHGVIADAVANSDPSAAPGFAGASTGIDSYGNSVSTVRGVGAHDAHVRKTNLRQLPLPCSQCHHALVPADGNRSHANGTAATAFDPALAASGGAVTWTGTTCAATYCHGNFRNGNGRFVAPAAPAAPPTGLTGRGLGMNAAFVSWTAVPGASLYYVERSRAATGAPWVGVGTTRRTSYTDVDLDYYGWTFFYRVTAWTPGGFGPTSGTVSAPAGANAGAQPTHLAGGAGAAPLGIDGTSDVVDQTTYPFFVKALGRTGYAESATLGALRMDRAMAPNSTYTVATLYSPPLAYANHRVAANVPLELDYIVYVGTASSSVVVRAELYEYNDATGDVGAAKGSYTSAAIPTATAGTRTTLTGNFGNPAFTVATGNRLKVVYQLVTPATAGQQVGLLFGSTRSTTNGLTFIAPTLSSTPFGWPTTAVTVVVARAEPNALTLTWNAVANAGSYKVERGPSGAGPWTQVGQTDATSFTDATLAPGTTYWYRVRGTFGGTDDPGVPVPVSGTTKPTPDGVATWAGTYAAGGTTLDCASCHGNPPGGSHPNRTDCSLCHFGYGDRPAGAGAQAVDGARHVDGVIDVDADCVRCHSYPMGTRSAAAREFASAWSHKRSAAGAVTKWDCVVCHMEGNPEDGGRSPVHADGVVNLRDPDTGQNIKYVTFSSPLAGGSAGAYSTPGGAQDAVFADFSRDLGVRFEADPAVSTLQAIMVNQCLKCHDANGADAYNGGKALSQMATAGGLTRTAGKPFGTTITLNANYNGGTGLTACGPGTNGCVTDVATSFSTGNASYHPVMGRQDNSYVGSGRMYPPWNNAFSRTAGSTNVYGNLISCWDCHAPEGATGPQSASVTAHGAQATLRRAAWITNTTNLCTVCHNVGSAIAGNHGAGSAFAAGGSPNMSFALTQSCHACHGSSVASGGNARPIRGEDAHGFDGFALNMGTDRMWPLGPTDTYKPYAFFRNVGPSGNWRTAGRDWKPSAGPNVPAGGPNCGGWQTLGFGCTETHSNYGPGGTF